MLGSSCQYGIGGRSALFEAFSNDLMCWTQNWLVMIGVDVD
jgi:hypothetical protein